MRFLCEDFDVGLSCYQEAISTCITIEYTLSTSSLVKVNIYLKMANFVRKEKFHQNICSINCVNRFCHKTCHLGMPFTTLPFESQNSLAAVRISNMASPNDQMLTATLLPIWKEYNKVRLIYKGQTCRLDLLWFFYAPEDIIL